MARAVVVVDTQIRGQVGCERRTRIPPRQLRRILERFESEIGLSLLALW